MEISESEYKNIYINRKYESKNKIIYKKSSIHGLGVFAIEKIKEGEIIEVAPVLVIDKKESQFIDKTVLYHYYFDWGKEKIAIALGYGSLYNHSYRPNSYYIKNLDNNEIIFIALKDIEKNEEITINYNGSPNCCDKLWFEMANN